MSYFSEIQRIIGTKNAGITFDKVKGRCLTARVKLKPGTTILFERAFSGILTDEEKTETKLCCNCFKDIHTLVSCGGCAKENYCSTECRRLSWKSYHWLECFMVNILSKLSLEIRMSLRILLDASRSMFSEKEDNCESLHKVANAVFHESEEIGGTNKESYSGDYFNMYSLETHENEQTTKDIFAENIKDIRILTKLVIKCISMCDKIKDPEKSEKINCEKLIHPFFRKLSFVHYYTNDKFDVLSWRSHVMESCKSVSETKGLFSSKSLKEIFFQKPSSEQDLLERLLVHHVLQIRTNGQAIFKVSQNTGSFNVQNMEQKRFASAVFPQSALMNHSCDPNVAVSFEGRTMIVKASQPIEKGEDIEHCYGPHYARHEVNLRRQILRDRYFFTCSCVRCKADLKEDEEMNSFRIQFHAFKCTHCGDPLRKDKSQQNTVGSATCLNKNCHQKQELSCLNKTYETFQELLADVCTLIDNEKLDVAKLKLEKCLKIGEKILYRNHVDIGLIHDKIAQCYVMQEDYASSILHLTKSITIIGMKYGIQSVEIAHELQKLASSYFNLGKLKQAEKNAIKVLSIYETNFSCNAFPPGTDEMKQIIRLCKCNT